MLKFDFWEKDLGIVSHRIFCITFQEKSEIKRILYHFKRVSDDGNCLRPESVPSFFSKAVLNFIFIVIFSTNEHQLNFLSS